MKTLFFTILLLFSMNIFAESLNSQRIWKISSRKRSIFLDKGVFHSNQKSPAQLLKNVRNSYVQSRGYERLVLDFSSEFAPKVYGFIDKAKGKLFVDLFNTSLGTNIQKINNVKYVKAIDFYTIDKDRTSIEVNVKKGASFDIFYLNNPGRLVIDIK